MRIHAGGFPFPPHPGLLNPQNATNFERNLEQPKRNYLPRAPEITNLPVPALRHPPTPLSDPVHLMEPSADQMALLTSEIMVKNEKVTILHHTKGAVYLLGTHHNRENSAVAVNHLIRIVRPHIVAVELCRTNLERYNELDDGQSQQQVQPPPPVQEEFVPKSSYLNIIPLRLKDKAIGEELLLGLVSESLKYDRFCAYRNRMKRFALKNPQTRRFRVRPKVFHDVVIGREMTAPFGNLTWTLPKANSKYLVNRAFKYRIMLADKPVEDTFCSVASALSAEERNIIHIYQTNFLKLFVASSTTKTIMMNMIEKNGRLFDAIVRERDEYMARSLRQALDDAETRPTEKARVIAILGKNHIPGVIKYWLKALTGSTKYRPPE